MVASGDESRLPGGLAVPARRTLAAAGVRRLGDLVRFRKRRSFRCRGGGRPEHTPRSGMALVGSPAP